jgi:hypothetical protein
MRALAGPSCGQQSTQYPNGSSVRLDLSLDFVSEGAFPSSVYVSSVRACVRACVCTLLLSLLSESRQECLGRVDVRRGVAEMANGYYHYYIIIIIIIIIIFKVNLLSIETSKYIRETETLLRKIFV